MELVERAAPLEELGRLLREAGRGTGRLVFVGGEAGVGKTTLVRHLVGVHGKASHVVEGACDPLATPRPLGPLVDIALRTGGALPRLLRRAARRDEIFQAFVAELGAGGVPWIVVVEDVHWADEATLDLLRFLARRVEGTGSLVLVTYRDDEAGPDHPLRRVLGDLATAPAVRRITLAPLSVDAVRELVAGSGLDPVELHRRTGGNPFFVTEVLAAAAPGIPASVRDTVQARVARLPPEARATLEAAAVVGPRAEPWLLAALLGPAPLAVDACLESGMVRREGPDLAFRHELAREAVLDGMAHARLVLLHGRALRALEPRAHHDPDVLARLVHHAEGAGDRDALLAHGPAAARRAASLRAHREAAAHYERTLRVAEGLPPAERAALLDEEAYEHYVTGRVDEGIAALRAAHALWEASREPVRAGDDLRWLSRLHWVAGRGPEALRLAREAIEVLEARPPGRELAMAYSNLAQLRMLARDRVGAVRWGRRAIDLAERIGDTEALVHALNNVGTATFATGDDSGVALLRRSLGLARTAGLDEHVARAYCNLATDYGEQYRFAQADRYLAAGIEYCAERDFTYLGHYMRAWRALTTLYRGGWGEAAAEAAAVLRLAGVAVPSRITALLVLGRVRARRGDPEIWPALDEALALADGTGDVQRLAPVRAARAEAAWLAGDPARTVEEARAAIDSVVGCQHPWFAGELLWWCALGGERPEVPSWVARPFALQLDGRWSEAAARWERLGCPYEAAQARAESGRAADVRAALETLTALGARPAAALAARRLRALGIRGLPRGPRSSTRANPAGLTAREVEVVRLVAQGLPNAQIGARLRISGKTVDHHVSSALGKLGARNRTGAAHEARRLGLLDPGSRSGPT